MELFVTLEQEQLVEKGVHTCVHTLRFASLPVDQSVCFIELRLEA